MKTLRSKAESAKMKGEKSFRLLCDQVGRANLDPVWIPEDVT